MRVVDSSGWIEYLQGTERASFFAPAIEKSGEVVVPSISIYEVHRLIAAKLGETAASAAVEKMARQMVVPMDVRICVAASRISRQHGLAAADAMIYATAQEHGAELWTQDAHFKKLESVRYFHKP